MMYIVSGREREIKPLMFSFLKLKENLRESDRTLYQEFENIRSMIQEIQEAQLQEQKKHLNGTFHDRSPSPTELNSEENVSEMLFEEYFGTFLRRKKQGLSTDRPQSLHLPKINGERNYSQTLV